MNGKCPSCQTTISSVEMTGIDVRVKGKDEFQGVSYCCPSCGLILGVGIDPFALKSDTVVGVMKELKKMSQR